MNIQKFNKPIIKLSLVFLFLIVFTRALFTSFTHDEAFTFLHYVANSFDDLIHYNYVTANNHLLNSLLTKVSYHLIGQSELALRLPNVIAFLFFLITFYKWIFLVTNKYPIILFSITIIFLNPHEFDFFSLSRGYGLSFLFLFLSLKHLYSSHNPSQLRKTSLFFLWLILMVLSNFSTLIVYFPIIFVYNLLNINSGKKHFFYGLSLTIISIIILALIITDPILKLIENKQLYFGGNNNFFSDTIISLYNGFKYGVELPPFISYSIIAFIGIALVISIILFVKTKFNLHNSNSFKILMIITLTVLTSISQHYILGSLFLIDRTALFLYILLAFFIISMFIDLSKKYNLNKVFDLSLYTLSGLIVIHFIITFNFESYRDWRHDTNTKEIAFGLNEMGKANNHVIMIGTPSIFEPSINYYYKSRNLQWITPIVREKLHSKSDIYYVLKSDHTSLPGEMILISSFPEAETNLFINPFSKLNDQSKANYAPFKLQASRWDF